MSRLYAFTSSALSSSFAPASCVRPQVCKGQRVAQQTAKERRSRTTARASESTSDDSPSEEQVRVDRMRKRLEGLFGSDEEDLATNAAEDFDGVALRAAVRERWGVEYDVQPQKRHGKVYVQIMWRYFEQQSFYMEEEEFASHCEAVAQLLRKWNAVDYFCDYIASIKKRPVVGITINIPIPGVDAATVVLE